MIFRPMIFRAKKEEIEDGRGKAWWRDFAWENLAARQDDTLLYPTMSQRLIGSTITAIGVTPSLVPLVALKCTSCGAPMKRATYQCEYCGTQYGPAIQKIMLSEPKDPTIQTTEDELKRIAKKTAKTIDYDVALNGLAVTTEQLNNSFTEILTASRKFTELGLLAK